MCPLFEWFQSFWTFLIGSGAGGLGDLFTGVGTIGLAIAAIKGDILGAKKAKEVEKATLEEKIAHEQFQYKFRVAQQAINVFNRIREDIRQIRSPFGMEGELNRLKSLEETNEMIKNMKRRTDGGLALMRMDDRAESLAEMNRLEAEFRALFGDVTPFETIRDIRHKIWVAAYMLTQGSENRIEDSKIIWGGHKEDKIQDEVSAAVTKIEEICQPILRGTE